MDMPQPQQILSKSVACGNKFISVFTYQLRNSAATISEDGKQSDRQTDRKTIANKFIKETKTLNLESLNSGVRKHRLLLIDITKNFLGYKNCLVFFFQRKTYHTTQTSSGSNLNKQDEENNINAKNLQILSHIVLTRFAEIQEKISYCGQIYGKQKKNK